MTAQKQRFPSIATTISALGIILYCVGFLRVELELKNQRERLQALENISETKPPSSDPNIAKFIKVARGMYFSTSSNTVLNFMPSEIVLPILLRTFQASTQLRSTLSPAMSKSVKEYDRYDFLCLSKANKLSRSFSGSPNTVHLNRINKGGELFVALTKPAFQREDYQTISTLGQGHPTSIFGKYQFGRRFEI